MALRFLCSWGHVSHKMGPPWGGVCSEVRGLVHMPQCGNGYAALQVLVRARRGLREKGGD